MDIRNLGGRAASSARNEAAPRVRGDAKSERSVRTDGVGDRSSVSSNTNRLRELGEVARQEPASRSDAVARGRALIESGGIDDPAVLERAAENFLGGF